VAGERLPKVPYRTLIDKYVDASFMTQIFTVISTVLVENYEEKDLWLVGENLNLWFFVIQASLFTLFHIYFCYELYQYNLEIDESSVAQNVLL
jgi:hypothetical protein